MRIKNKKIAFASPYFHIKGGGERYILTIASYLSRENEITFFSDKKTIFDAMDFFSLQVKNPVFKKNLNSYSFLEKFMTLSGYDVFFYMTDGSIQPSFSNKNFLIIQSPAHTVGGSFLNKIMLAGWHVICYSKFMKDYLAKEKSLNSTIVPPGIDSSFFQESDVYKKNIILSVGRYFSSHLHVKNHRIMIEVFKNRISPKFPDWNLVLAGAATEKSSVGEVEDLKSLCRGENILVLANISQSDLLKKYGEARIYWHAAGFGADRNDPQKLEHFGMTTAEAMASGCVPVVFGGGGQLDIVQDNINGFFWSNKKDLAQKTINLIKNGNLLSRISSHAKKKALDFSMENFYENIERIIQN